MKNKIKNKRLIPLILCVILMAWALFGFLTKNVVSGEERATYSDVMDDLKASTIDGKPFDISDYPYLENGSPQVFAFTECCFSLDEDVRQKYCLFVYVYNPGGIVFSEVGNSIQIATQYDNSGAVTLWNKYDLEFCSKSVGADVAELFYKFRIVDNIYSIYNRVAAVPASRRYDISGIELTTSGDILPHDYEVAGTYKFSGYASGCDENKSEESTLTSTVTDITNVLRLNVKSTFWRSSSSSLGKSYRNELDSVYFSVPNSLLEQYGKLNSIHATWYETRIFGNVYNNLDDYLYYGVGTDWANCSNGSLTTGMCFYREQKDPFVSLQAINEYIQLHRNHSDDSVFHDAPSIPASCHFCQGDSVLFPDSIGDFSADEANKGRKFGKNDVLIDAKQKYDLLSYDDTHTFWDKVEDFGFWNTIFGGTPSDSSLKGIKPIMPIEYNTYNSISSEMLASNLYVDSHDAEDFSDYVKNAWRNNETPYLFRFAVTQYYALNWSDRYNFKQQMFFNFDIIDLGFYSETGHVVVIPVVSDPINISGGTEPAIEPTTIWDDIGAFFSGLWKSISSFFSDWWWIFLIVLGLIPIIIFFPVIGPILGVIVKAIGMALWWIISAPVRFIKWCIDKIHDRKDSGGGG